MKGIISSHSALNAYQRQSAVDPVSVRQAPVPSEGAGSSTGVRAARVSISAEARALAEGGAHLGPAVEGHSVERSGSVDGYAVLGGTIGTDGIQVLEP